VTNTLYDALIAPHANNPANFLDLDDGTSWRYSDFVTRVAQIAHVLKDAGVSPGDRVVVQGPKTADALALYGAAVQAGAVYLPLNTAYTETEVRYFIDDAAPALIVCDPVSQNAMTAILRKTPQAAYRSQQTHSRKHLKPQHATPMTWQHCCIHQAQLAGPKARCCRTKTCYRTRNLSPNFGRSLMLIG